MKVFSLIFNRLAFAIPMFLGISFISFGIVSLSPGNYFDTLRLNPQISEATIEKYEQQYHLEEAWFVQYWYWLKSLLKLDLGYSFSQKTAVFTVVKKHFFNTIVLALSALFFTWCLGLPLGIYCAVHKNQLSEKIFSFFSFIGLSLPPFFLALICLYLLSLAHNSSYFSFINNLIPIGGMKSIGYDKLTFPGKIFDILKHLLVPTIAISVGAIASLQRIAKGNLLEILRKQYITMAVAYGLPQHSVVYVYAFKNAVNPLLTILGYQLGGLLGGAALVEIICNWPGLGKIMLLAVRSQDIFLVMGGLVISGFLLLLGNLLADILLGVVDPRIEYKKIFS